MPGADVWVCPECGTIFGSVYAFDLHVCDVDQPEDGDDDE